MGKKKIEELSSNEEIFTNVDINSIPLLPLKNVVLLPRTILPVIVARESSIQAINHALNTNKIVFVSAQKNAQTEHPSEHDVYTIGTRATILQSAKTPNGSLKILIEGICRSRISSSISQEGIITVLYEDIPLPILSIDNQIELKATWRTVYKLYTIYAQLNDKTPQDLLTLAKNISETEDIDYFIDTLASQLNLSIIDKQYILETTNINLRLLRIGIFLQKEIDILQIEQRIKGHIQDQFEKTQREYYLTEQIKAINKELGRDDQQTEFKQIRDKIKSLKPPQDIIDKVEKELKKLEQMPPLSAESTVSRNYVDWIASLPWSTCSKDRVSLKQAESILNSQHAGLKKAKDRIIEFLAAKKFSKQLERSPIICLVGPPGVGKTSLAKSIAESLNREFVRIALGGVKDEAEIRGHRRTYIGAMPGKIIQTMKRANTINPVILLDEIDKMSLDVHSDPASALLEVLDPEQNKKFTDHFIDAEYDLSKVMFITTANHIDGIPHPLFDRMEVITLSGYTNEEKLLIAKKFLLPKNLHEYNLTKDQCIINDDILKLIIFTYTKEAGVRNLERCIAKLMRKTIQILLKNKKVISVEISKEQLREWFGNPPFKDIQLEKEARIGLATGLAWTELGGDVLETEAIVLPGKGSMTLTGQLGEVMQESAHAALSYIRSRADALGLPKNFYTNKDVHIHLPEGATPKDGPSAGITMCTALVSALSKNPIKAHLAMTGEITLRGRIIGVGGLKEKLLAAKQHHIKIAIIPFDNKEDIIEILPEIGQDLQLIYVKNMDEVLELALVEKAFNTTTIKKTNTPKKTKKKSIT